MLVLANFDSVNLPLLERLIAEGRMPTVAELFRRGRRLPLATSAERFPAAGYFDLYSGQQLADHGIYYTFMWSPGEQRIRFIDSFPVPPSVWERVSAVGARVLIVDPYEAPKPQLLNGLCVAGWQVQNRVVLPGWSVPQGALRGLSRKLGSPPKVEEVLGVPSLAMLRTMRQKLVAASPRISALCRHLLAREHFDLVWLSFSAAHFAGHQFFDLSQVRASELEAAKQDRVQEALAEVYVSVDTALGEILELLPADSKIILFSALGMGPNRSRVDLLPRMLDAVLSGRRAGATGSPGSSLWWLRGAVPTRLRAAVADALPRRAVLELTARLETRGVDWSGVRAFALPSDGPGCVRLNLRGRERDGVVDPAEADALIDEISAGLASFNDPDGTPTVAAVEKVSDLLPDARTTIALPDLVVRWSDRSANRLDRVVSPRFGEVPRLGQGSGRSGNHTPEAWAVVVGPSLASPRSDGERRLTDVAATICAAFGAELEGLAGHPLFVP